MFALWFSINEIAIRFHTGDKLCQTKPLSTSETVRFIKSLGCKPLPFQSKEILVFHPLLLETDVFDFNLSMLHTV